MAIKYAGVGINTGLSSKLQIKPSKSNLWRNRFDRFITVYQNRDFN